MRSRRRCHNRLLIATLGCEAAFEPDPRCSRVPDSTPGVIARAWSARGRVCGDQRSTSTVASFAAGHTIVVRMLLSLTAEPVPSGGGRQPWVRGLVIHSMLGPGSSRAHAVRRGCRWHPSAWRVRCRRPRAPRAPALLMPSPSRDRRARPVNAGSSPNRRSRRRHAVAPRVQYPAGVLAREHHVASSGRSSPRSRSRSQQPSPYQSPPTRVQYRSTPVLLWAWLWPRRRRGSRRTELSARSSPASSRASERDRRP